MARGEVMRRLAIGAATAASALVLLSVSGSQASVSPGEGVGVKTEKSYPVIRTCMSTPTTAKGGEECSCALQARSHPERLRDAF
jgi:hypothetical protein